MTSVPSGWHLHPTLTPSVNDWESAPLWLSLLTSMRHHGVVRRSFLARMFPRVRSVPARVGTEAPRRNSHRVAQAS